MNDEDKKKLSDVFSLTENIVEEENANFIESFPALLWNVDIVRNQIEFINNYMLEGFGDDAGLLIKNMNYSKNVIYNEDFCLYKNFMKALKEGRPAETIFRTTTKEGETRWIKLIGMTNKKRPEVYLGAIMDVTDAVQICQIITGRDAELQAMIEFAENPVLLVDLETKAILAHNKGASDLLNMKPAEFRNLNFSDLYDRSVGHYIDRIYEEVVFEKKWEGTLVFRRKANVPIAADVIIRALWLEGKQVLRVSIHDVRKQEKTSKNHVISFADFDVKDDLKRQYQQRLLAEIKGINDIVEVLRILLTNQFDKPKFHAIMFSDIYARKKRVNVYTAGDVFTKLRQGETFPYEGTIAENIENFKLERLIVEDTFSSIKPIDWALFIPYGVRSYFAKAFYSRKVMRAVLILCSTEPGMFSESRTGDYELLYPVFLKGLTNWRRRGPSRGGKQ